MPLQGSRWINHRVAGGWATDYGLTAYESPDQAGHIDIPFLRDARNVVYEFDGGVRKIPGANLLNSTVLVDATTTVAGVYDYWRQGTSGSATQRRVVHAGTTIQADVADGVFSNIATGLVDAAIPHYSTFDDFLIIGSSASADVPRSWDQTTFQNLAGSPPRFSFSVSHQNRQWAAGVYTTPSRLYYSGNLDPEDWTGGTSGSIDIDPNDGDAITAIIPHKNELWVFKGPYRGSIHRITGASPSAFARTTFVTGLAVGWINSVFRFGDDVGFITAYGTVHSLKVTAAFGDYNESYLSYPIASYVRDDLALSRNQFFTSVNDPSHGRVWIGVTPSGQTTNTRHLLMDYRFLTKNESYPRWSYFDTQSFASLAWVRDSDSVGRVFAGSYTGRVFRHGQENRTVNGTAINYNVQTPAMTYGDEWLLKTLGDVGVSIQALNNNNISLSWTGDGVSLGSATVTQGQTGSVFGTGLFGTATFGGDSFQPRFFNLENGGEFRAISYTFSDSVNESDIAIHRVLAKISGSGESQENT